MSGKEKFDPATDIQRAYFAFQSSGAFGAAGANAAGGLGGGGGGGGWANFMQAFVSGVAFGALRGRLTQEEIVQAVRDGFGDKTDGKV